MIKYLAPVILSALVGAVPSAHATIIESANQGTGANMVSSVAGTATITFDSGTFANSAGASFSGTGAILLQGLPSLDAAPDGDTTPFLGVPGPDPTLASGTETISFNAFHDYFGLFWGSIDAYNTISFYDNGALVASYGGAQITANADGDQSASATNEYVNFAFSGADLFNQVLLSSDGRSFEVDNIAVDTPAAAVSEPAAVAVLGSGLALLGLGAWRRQRFTASV